MDVRVVMSLYTWLKFLHLAGLGIFLFGHGIVAATSFGLRGQPDAGHARALLRYARNSYGLMYPGLLLLLVTGVWMGFLGRWWGQAWIWTAIVIFVVVTLAMGFIGSAYHSARDAQQDDAALQQRLTRARPTLAAWLGSLGLLALIFLMVFKPF
jgi:uncharacterized membrane protein